MAIEKTDKWYGVYIVIYFIQLYTGWNNLDLKCVPIITSATHVLCLQYFTFN